MFDLEEYGRVPINQVREKVVEQLKLNFAHDNIDDKELEERLEQADRATSKKQLLAVVEDLPALDDASAGSGAAQVAGVAINRGKVPETATLVSILSGTERKGRWLPARYTNGIAFMGGMELDFRYAEFPPGVTEINFFCLMGGAELTVPPGLNVEVHGIPILGGIENKADSRPNPAAPTLRIKALVIMGGLEIKAKE
jgi:hypothetical protein